MLKKSASTYIVDVDAPSDVRIFDVTSKEPFMGINKGSGVHTLR